MPEYLAPGVFVEEIELGAKSIEGVSTSTVGFVGKCERGPLKPKLIVNFSDYQRIYGGYLKDSFMTYQVDGFFKNGGKRCFVARIISKDATHSTLDLDKSSGAGKSTAVKAIGPGGWGNRIVVDVSDATLNDDNLFKLKIKYFDEKIPSSVEDDTVASFEEVYDDLSSDPKSGSYYEKVVNGTSPLIALELKNEGRPKNTEWKKLENGTDNGTESSTTTTGSGKKATTSTSTTPSEWNMSKDDFAGREVQVKDSNGDIVEVIKTGLLGFKQLTEISIVVAPDENKVVGLTDEIISHCENLKDRFAIIQAPQDAVTKVGTLFPPKDSKYAAYYMPWINIIDPLTNTGKLIPPGGHVSGIYARSDVERGVHKAPANEVVRGVSALQLNIDKGIQEVLNPKGINVIRSFPGRGPTVWGARTVSRDPLWTYVNVRRLFIFLEKSIEQSTQWVVFEPNNERLWARVRATITNFLTSIWRSGALMGTTPDEAFFVRCDRSTMTQNDIDTGKLICIIGVAPTKPAEFVIFRLAQTKPGATLEEF